MPVTEITAALASQVSLSLVVTSLELARVQDNPDEVVEDGVSRDALAHGRRSHFHERNRAVQVHLKGRCRGSSAQSGSLVQGGVEGSCGQ